MLSFSASCAVQKTPAVSPPPVPSPVTIEPSVIAGPEEGFKLAMDAYAVADMETTIAAAQQVVEHYPGSPWSKRSLFLIGRAFIALDRPYEAAAVMLRVPNEYPELADYALYFLAEYYFSKNRYPEAIKLYQQISERYPKSLWAARSVLRRAESLLESGAYPQATEAFEKFLRDNPRSDLCPDAGLGLGKALAAEGKVDQAVRTYKDLFVRYPGSPAETDVEKALADLKANGVQVFELTADEVYERAKNLFKAGQYDKAYTAFIKVLKLDQSYQSKIDVLLRSGISLFYLGRRSEAAAVLEKTMKEHPGDRGAETLYWLAKTYDKLGRKEDAVASCLKIASSYPDSEWADDALYYAGNIYRESNDLKRALKIYSQLSAQYPQSKFSDSAVWWKAWALFTAGEFTRAEQTLQELINTYPKSFLVNQAGYWQGRAAEKIGNPARAAVYYEKVLKRAPYSYYGYRAADRLSALDTTAQTVSADVFSGDSGTDEDSASGDTQNSDDPDGRPVWTAEAVRMLSAQPSFKKSLELMHLNMKKEAADELSSLQEKLPKKRGMLLGLSKTYFELGDYYRSLMLVLRNYERYLDRPAKETSPDLWLLAYPQGYWSSIVSYSRKYGQDPYFIAAIIREESQFHADAISRAGARGVMQVMPSTGQRVAQAIRMAGFDRDKLFDYDTAINIGTWYVSRLMKRFKGDPILVAAAYNAGPDAASSWLAKNGSSMDRDEFVESIPFLETRGYVKKVLRNYAEYKRIYGRPAQKLSLTRSLPTGTAELPAAQVMKTR